MKSKDLLISAFVFMLIYLGLQWFIGNPQGMFRKQTENIPSTDQLKSGQYFTAPVTALIHQPLKTEIDFFDKPADRPLQTHVIETPYIKLLFSNNGASVYNITFKRVQGGVERELTTFALDTQNREQEAFLVALEENTPYYYQLLGKEETDTFISITYSASTPQVVITKKFVIYKALYKIDLTVTLEPRNNAFIQPRIYFPGPQLADIRAVATVMGLVNTERNTIKKVVRDAQLATQYWVAPTLFGAEDRYFVHALVNDQQQFIQRAYYKLYGTQGITGILEGQPTKEKQTWNLSFYVGPKEAETMAAIDPRLETTLDYGWLAPLSKLMLTLLKTFYAYVHNYGLAIILITLLIRLLLLPLTIKGEKSMQKRGELQRKLQYLEKKYKDDRETLLREKGELIRKHGVSDIAGCFPFILQLPLFFALNRVLANSIELYQAPFIGWITDLSVKDPYYVLPALAVLGMMLQMASTGEVRQRLPGFLTAIVFGAIILGLPAGLNLFIAVGTWLSIIQTYTQKKLKL